jgi:V8-like Glu-specific endopeptidase
MKYAFLIFILLFKISLGFSGIFGKDNRVEVKNFQYPWSSIGRLTIGSSQCTAALIGPCQILTAAHCLISEQTQNPINQPMIFISHGDHFRANLVFHYYTLPQDHFLHEENDWVISILDKPIGNEIGWFGVAPQGPTAKILGPFNIAGYNSDLFDGLKLTNDSEATSHYIYNNNIMSLEANTFTGASGAPIWQFNENSNPVIYGIHVGAEMDFDQSSGDFVQKELKEYSAMEKADGIASAQFWNTYQESLNYKCPK